MDGFSVDDAVIDLTGVRPAEAVGLLGSVRSPHTPLVVHHDDPDGLQAALRNAGLDASVRFAGTRAGSVVWRPGRLDSTSAWVLEHWQRAVDGIALSAEAPPVIGRRLDGLRLLLVCHEATRTGAPLVLLTVARWLVAQGASVATVVLVPGPLLAEFAALGLVVRPSGGRLDLAALPDCDLVYGNTAVASQVVTELARRGCATLLHTHELDHAIDAIGRRRVAEAVIASRGLVTVSAASEAALRRLLGPIDRPITRVAPPLTPERFAEAAALGAHRHRAGRFVTGGFGTFCWLKGGDLLARCAGAAAARAEELGSAGWDFRWVGHCGEDAEALLAAVAADGLADRLSFLGEHARPLELVAEFDVLALLSRQDSYPLAMSEAALVGVPTLAQRGSGGPEQFAGGGGAAVVDAEDHDAVLRALQTLDRHPELRTLMAEAGRRTVLREQSIDSVGPRLATAIVECIGRQRAGRVGAGEPAEALVGSTPPVAPEVSIVIPLFNRVDMTERCLRQLARTVDPAVVELVVVDNGSSDGSAETVAQLWPSATIVRNAVNQGFARGCNQGVAAARGERVVLVNNDTEASTGWLEALLAPLDEPDVAIVAPKLLFPDGTLQHAGMGVVEDRKNGLALNGVHLFYRELPSLAAANRRRDLQLVTGAVMALRRGTFTELGGFDEGYWNGCEDVDLCFKAAAAGYRVVYEPASVLLHHESASGAARWTKVTDNLRRLAERWAGQIEPDVLVLPDGSVVPCAGTTVSQVAAGLPGQAGESGQTANLTVAIDGAAFRYHSLSQVNRELAVRLADRHGIDVVARSNVLPEVTAADDPRLVPLVLTARRSEPAVPDVTIRHQWPPDWTAPADGSPVVVIQPWEFGGLPDEWIEPLQSWPDEIWCYTSWVRDCYLRSGIPADRLVVVPLGVDGERFRPDGPRHPLATTKGRRLLFVGGLIRRKGVDLLLEAYGRAFRDTDDVCLVIKAYGVDGVYRSSNAVSVIEQFRRRPGAPEIELITDDLDQAAIASLYRSCDALVHPYRGEGFGLPIAEAMASGLPVIVTDDGAARDFCDERTAFLVPSRRRSVTPESLQLGPSRSGYWEAEVDLDALVSILRQVLDDPASASAVAAAGRARVTEQLSWDRIADDAAQRLRALAARPARRALALDPYRAGRPPYLLDDPRGRTLLLVAGPNRTGWSDAATVVAGALRGDDDATLVVAIEAADRAAQQQTLDRLAELLDGCGGDVLAVPEADDDIVAGLLVGTDAVLATADAELQDRAARCAATVLPARVAAVTSWLGRTKSPGQAA